MMRWLAGTIRGSDAPVHGGAIPPVPVIDDPPDEPPRLPPSPTCPTWPWQPRASAAQSGSAAGSNRIEIESRLAYRIEEPPTGVGCEDPPGVGGGWVYRQ